MRRAARAVLALLCGFLLALALLAADAEAQVAVDSVEVQIYAPGDILVTIAPRTFTGLVGDTVRFSAVAIDAPTGDTIPDVLLRWSTPNPAAVSIDPMSGEAVFLSRGRWRIRVEVERVGGIVMMELRNGDVFPIPEEGIRFSRMGQTKQLCAYLLNTRTEVIARHPDICPIPGVAPYERQARLPFDDAFRPDFGAALIG